MSLNRTVRKINLLQEWEFVRGVIAEFSKV